MKCTWFVPGCQLVLKATLFLLQLVRQRVELPEKQLQLAARARGDLGHGVHRVVVAHGARVRLVVGGEAALVNGGQGASTRARVQHLGIRVVTLRGARAAGLAAILGLGMYHLPESSLVFLLTG